MVVDLQAYYGIILAGIIAAVLITIKRGRQKKKEPLKKQLPKETANYIIILENKNILNHRLLLKYFDGIKSFEYPLKPNTLLEIKVLGTLAEGLLQIILINESGMPIKIIKRINYHILKYRAEEEGMFIIKIIGCQAKGKFGIECKILD